jgi:hypothetical protein
MHAEGIHAKSQQGTMPQFDIVKTKITTRRNIATFHMQVSGKAGESKLTEFFSGI